MVARTTKALKKGTGVIAYTGKGFRGCTTGTSSGTEGSQVGKSKSQLIFGEISLDDRKSRKNSSFWLACPSPQVEKTLRPWLAVNTL